jgi:hypothetical protein
MSSLFNTQDPAIRAAQERVLEQLFAGPRILLNIEQQKLKTAVRDQHKDMRRAAAELAAAQIDRSPLVVVDDAMEEAA